MKKVLALLVLPVVALLGLEFALLNSQPVQFNYYFGSLEAPLALIIVVTLFLGSVTGGLVCMGAVLKEKSHNAGLRKRIGVTEKELRNLREIPLKDRQ